MINTDLQALEKVQESTKQLKLIEGKFSKSQALSIINSVVDVKINFHKLQRLSIIEGNINDKCVYDNSRITALIKDKSDMKEYLKSIKSKDCTIKISSTIHVSIE